MDDITIVIPTFNEECTIADIITRCKKHSDDIIVADGHSTDNTAEVARGCGARVVVDHGKGKGDAIRTALAQPTRAIVVLIDADGSHDPDDIPRLIAPILAGEADHVTGSRLIGGSSELHGGFDEFFRLTGNAFITACINWKFGTMLSDSQNGFRAVRAGVLRTLDLREDTATIEQEMLIKTIKRGFKVSEVPTHEHKRTHGVSKIVVSRVWVRFLFTFLKFLFF